jgi:hypothetical protein
MDQQAFAQLLGNYGEFVGAIAVVATLVYLAIQVRHSKEATEFNPKQVEQSNLLALAQNQIARVNLIEHQVRDLTTSSEMAEIIVRYESQGIDALDEVERFRFWNWHIIQHYLLDSVPMMVETYSPAMDVWKVTSGHGQSRSTMECRPRGGSMSFVPG